MIAERISDFVRKGPSKGPTVLGLVKVVGVEILGLKVDPVDETIEEGWLLWTGRIGRLTSWIAGN